MSPKGAAAKSTRNVPLKKTQARHRAGFSLPGENVISQYCVTYEIQSHGERQDFVNAHSSHDAEQQVRARADQKHVDVQNVKAERLH
jgi:hypothetical protein